MTQLMVLMQQQIVIYAVLQVMTQLMVLMHQHTNKTLTFV